MAIRKRLQALPEELHDVPVIFAALSLLGPLFIVFVALAAGQTEVTSPLYSLAAIVFVAGIGGFLVASVKRLKVRRVENERLEVERVRRRHMVRLSASPMSRSRRASEQPAADTRRAS